MPRNIVGVVKPYTNEEFNKIVARGEHRLGIRYFIGHPEAEVKVVMPAEEAMTVFEQTSGIQYNEVLAKAVDNIKGIKDYRGSRVSR